MTRHLLDLCDLSAGELAVVLDLAREAPEPVLRGHGVAVLMGLPSLRTRNATELAVADLGGHPVSMTAAEVGLDERERAEDVARTLAQLHRVVCARVQRHDVLRRMADAIDAHGDDVGVVNLLSDEAHPVQAVADLLTIADAACSGRREALAGLRVAWIGDANNVARSLAFGAALTGVRLIAASPRTDRFSDADVARVAKVAAEAGLGGGLELVDEPVAAVEGAAAIATDVWVSMGQESERADRLARFAGFEVTEALLAAAPGAVLLHCLPAHRGEEITDGAFESPQSRIFEQVRARRAATRGVLRWLVDPPGWRR